MKRILYPLVLLISFATNAQVSYDSIQPAARAPYRLPLPEDWDRELFFIPFDFAPSIDYEGQEELQFAPGWASSKSEQYWTYAYLWYVAGHPALNADSVEHDLTAYYTGLIQRNVVRRNIPKEKQFPVQVNVTEIRGGELTDYATYQGSVRMLDYMSQLPIVLQIKVHVIACSNNHTAILFQASPKLLYHPVWKVLNGIRAGFSCR